MAATKIHILDPGGINYGDALVCLAGGKSILIDGARAASSRETTSQVNGRTTRHRPIQDQIREVLGDTHVDLLVITHCHSDHIGCLPELIANNTVTCDWALVADPDLGFGRGRTDALPPRASAMSPQQKLAAALREEPLLAGSDADIAAFIEDSAQQFEEYAALVSTLQERLGDQVVFYTGPTEDETPGLSALLEEFSPAGLTVLGPTQAQLLLCADFLAGRAEDNLKTSEDALMGETDLVDAYRRLTSSFADAADPDAENGNAVNNQSIILALSVQGKKMLLTGDMQFAKPQLDARTGDEVRALLTKVTAFGPYSFVKLSHHGATNGQNLTILRGWKAKRFAISTGARSTHHPTTPTRNALETLGEEGAEWARTDINGLVTYTVTAGEGQLSVDRGALNDLSPPTAQGDVGLIRPEGPGAVVPAREVAEARLSGVVEVTVKIPHRRTRVCITIDVQPDASDPTAAEGRGRTGPFDAPAPDVRPLWSGRTPLPRLLFATDAERLKAAAGATEGQVLDRVRASGQQVIDVPSGLLLRAVRARLGTDPTIRGVVLLGGYDVVPSQVLLTLPPNLRDAGIDDDDEFLVWSDDGYGDREGDGIPEVPVSRVPDAHNAAFLLKALDVSSVSPPTRRSGIRNINRPFADDIHGTLPGSAAMFTSEHQPPAGPPPFAVNGDLLYLMLHGQADDGTVFKGEGLTARGRYPIALSVADVPNPSPSVVFSGCCYGALTVDEPAFLVGSTNRRVTPRDPSRSIALQCLANGATAFVGCTGVHYSPRLPPYNYHGGPMHREFWSEHLAGVPPALALWRAKLRYTQSIPHLPDGDIDDVAYEYKIARQFTCLGLGW